MRKGDRRMRIEQLAEGVTLYCGDSRGIVPGVEDVDCVVTSPPYGQQRDYGQKIDDWRGLVSNVMTRFADPGQMQILVNLGLVHRDGEVMPYW
jgi:DNA modification methylase